MKSIVQPKQLLASALMLLCGLTAMAQTTITTYKPGLSTDGAVYYLPKTVLNVSVTVTKTTYTPGELCQYADRYLRIAGISSKSESYYTLQSATIATEAVPDENKLFHILFAPNTVAPLVTMTEDCILHAINMPVPEAEQPLAVPVAAEESQSLSPRSYMTEEMLMTGSKAKLAEIVAKEIYGIRESRNLIIRGQNEHMPKDAESLQIILAGLDEQEQALTQLFVGSIRTESFTETYQVIPSGEISRVVFARFSRKLGLLHGDDLAGAPIYIDVKAKQTLPEPMVEVVDEATTSKKGKRAKAKKQDENLQDGLVYNIPIKAEVKVYTNTQELITEQHNMAQLGRTETLSATLFATKKNAKVLLDPATGALLRVE